MNMTQHNLHWQVDHQLEDQVNCNTLGYGELSQYDPNCSQCWLGNPHTWRQHDTNLTTYYINHPEAIPEQTYYTPGRIERIAGVVTVTATPIAIRCQPYGQAAIGQYVTAVPSRDLLDLRQAGNSFVATNNKQEEYRSLMVFTAGPWDSRKRTEHIWQRIL